MKHFLTVIFICAGTLFYSSSSAQNTTIDALFSGRDTTAVMDSLMKDFDAYLDSVLQSKSFFNVSAGFGTGFFSFKDNAAAGYQLKNRAVFSPEISYFHKSGLGLTLTSYLLRDAGKINPYQFAFSPSYHIIKRNRFTTGISYSRFFTKENLSFFTTPIQNELYAFFNLKRWWLEPGIALSYGWGSKTEQERTEIEIYRRRQKSNPKEVIIIQTDESIKDFSALFSLRHSFNFKRFLLKNDRLTLRPVMLVSAGTQNFGFNTSFTNITKQLNIILPPSSHVRNIQGLEFQSSTLVMQVDYSIGNLYFMPQILMDYYLHPAEKRFNTVASFTVGVKL